MSNMLRDLSTASPVTAIEANLFSLLAAFRGWPQAEVHDEAEIMWSITDIPFPLFNSVMRAQLAPERIDATVQSIIAQAKSRNVPLLWWTGPATRPTDLGAHLERHGFTGEGQLPGMAVDLTTLSEHQSMPGGLTVQVVKDSATLKQWSQVLARGYGMPDFVAEALYDFMSYVDADTMVAYLGLLDNQPVATSTLMLAAGVAGIYNVATIPEARRKGIGAMMTLAPLRETRTRGYSVGILHSSEMGLDLYRSLGFQEYCRIGQYVWSAELTQGPG